MELFTEFGVEFLSRWGHVLAGVTWVGLLYYFNFVQVPAFAEFEAGPRTEAVRKLVPRALWWFRWSAVLTLVTGLALLFLGAQADGSSFASQLGTSIYTGILLALTMFANVWLVIWPNQRIVIANAETTAAGGEADPNAAAAGRRALLASRTNAFFSVPMLFFMVATSHFFTSDHFDVTNSGNRTIYWVIVLVLWAAAELNGLGKLGGTAAGGARAYLDTHRNTIIAGFVYTAVLYLLWEILLRA